MLNRAYSKVVDFSKQEIISLIDFSIKFKEAKLSNNEVQYLKGNNIAILVDGLSAKSQSIFEVACMEQGAKCTYIESNSSQADIKDPVEDTVKLLSRFYDAIEYRGTDKEVIEKLDKYATIPSYNIFSKEWRFIELLSDLLLITELKGDLSKLKISYLGYANSESAKSLIMVCSLLGIEIRVVSPRACWPNQEVINLAMQMACDNNGSCIITEDIQFGLKDCDVIYSDEWYTYNEEYTNVENRIQQLLPYQVSHTNVGYAKEDYMFMHSQSLLLSRDEKFISDLKLKYGVNRFEVTDEIFTGKNSFVYKREENLLHTLKAMLVTTLSQNDFLA